MRLIWFPLRSTGVGWNERAGPTARNLCATGNTKSARFQPRPGRAWPRTRSFSRREGLGKDELLPDRAQDAGPRDAPVAAAVFAANPVVAHHEIVSFAKLNPLLS